MVMLIGCFTFWTCTIKMFSSPDPLDHDATHILGPNYFVRLEFLPFYSKHLKLKTPTNKLLYTIAVYNCLPNVEGPRHTQRRPVLLWCLHIEYIHFQCSLTVIQVHGNSTAQYMVLWRVSFDLIQNKGWEQHQGGRREFKAEWRWDLIWIRCSIKGDARRRCIGGLEGGGRRRIKRVIRDEKMRQEV